MLSPAAVFEEKRMVIVYAAGLLSAMHIDIGFTSGFLTLIAGSKLFITFGVTKANLWVMQQYHLHLFTWEDAIHVMHMLEDAHVMYMQAGNTVYMAAGQGSIEECDKPMQAMPT